MRILNFGSLNIHRVYRVESFMRPGETVSSLGFDLLPGGKGLNQSVAVASAGSDIFHAGKIGADGEFLLDTLNQAGVNTEYIKSDGIHTGHAVIQVNKYGNNCILLHSGANSEITPLEIDEVLSHFEAGDILILQNEIGHLNYIINSAYDKYMRVVVNPSPMNDTIKAIDLRKVTYLILNELEGRELTGESRPSAILDYLLSIYPHLKIVLTLGKVGSLYADELHRLQQSVYNVDVADTTAAGDTFLGYFISRITMGSPSWSAMRAAAMAAALCVTKHGGATSIPLWDDVLNFSMARTEKKRLAKI
ncbi:MAG: ribokinase [Clostridiales bacterium]|nr:ribokinase [Clostridiales bacterium]